MQYIQQSVSAKGDRAGDITKEQQVESAEAFTTNTVNWTKSNRIKPTQKYT